MTIKKEPDDNIYCHQAPGYTANLDINHDLYASGI